MPLYDYRCENCHRWEERRPIEARHDTTTCPQCWGIGKYVFRGAPHFMWNPDRTCSPFKERVRTPQ